MSEYVRRVIDHELDELLPSLPAIAIEGVRAVGKTETALQRAETVYRLDDPAQREVVAAAPAQILEGDRPILVDEWQRVPATWDVVRRAVDDDRTPGRFILTGSATPSERPTHSGAGRIVTLRLRPMTLSERSVGTPAVSVSELVRGERPTIQGDTAMGLGEYVQQIVGSGFPGLRHLTGRALRAQLDGYLRRIADSDLPQLGRDLRDPGALNRWLKAYAAATATTASYETIRDAASAGEGDKPARSTTIPYRKALEQLWILDEVPGWLPSKNYFSRLSQAPKHHLADPALAARLLGVEAEALIRGESGRPEVPRDGTLLGHLFESLACLCLRVYAQAAEAEIAHLRLRGGRREVDLILERGDGRVVGVEVKLGRTVDDRDVKHLRWLQERLGGDLLDAMVVTTGPHAYRRPDGIAVVPAALLGP